MSISHLFITFLIGIIIYLFSLKEKFDTYGNNKTFLSDGQKNNKILLNKINERMKENCKNLTSEEPQANTMANKRLTCRYYSRCKDIAKINQESWNNPKIVKLKPIASN